jgi:GAF domain-containing protein
MDVSPTDRRRATPSAAQVNANTLAAPWRTDLVDGPPSERFDRVTQTVAGLLHVPMVAISLFDDRRQWALSTFGLPRGEQPRNFSPCSLVVDTGVPLSVADAPADPRYAHFPLVTGELKVRGYLSVPLRSDDDTVLGTLCVLDRRRRDFSADEQQVLSRFGKAVEHLLRRR